MCVVRVCEKVKETLKDKPFRKLYNCEQTEQAESFIER